MPVFSNCSHKADVAKYCTRSENNGKCVELCIPIFPAMQKLPPLHIKSFQAKCFTRVMRPHRHRKFVHIPLFFLRISKDKTHPLNK